jgi:hypothetical protein
MTHSGHTHLGLNVTPLGWFLVLEWMRRLIRLLSGAGQRTHLCEANMGRMALAISSPHGSAHRAGSIAPAMFHELGKS